MIVFRVIFGMIAEYALMEWFQILGLFHRSPPREWMKGMKGDIVLVPGFHEPWVFFRFLGNRLNAAGYRVQSIPGNLRALPVVKAATLLATYLEKHNLRDVVLLSHSRGGLTAKYLLNHLNSEARVRRSISISTPYGGTLLGYLHLFQLAELRPDSPLIRAESKHTENNGKIVQLYSTVDNHVLPNKNLILPGAKNIRIDIIGHTRIFNDERTLSAILEHLS